MEFMIIRKPVLTVIAEIESVSGDRDAVEIDRPVRRHMRIGCDRGQGELVGQRPVAPQRDQIEVVIPREVEVRVPVGLAGAACRNRAKSEEHTSELQSLMRISYAVFCLKKKKKNRIATET